MPLVNSNLVLQKAQQEGYAVGAFNAENMEMVQAIISSSEEMRAPVIIQTTPSTLKYADLNMFVAMVATRAEKAVVPIVLHLDHGDSYALCVAAIKAGYTSVMYDGSKLPYAENVTNSSKTAETGIAADVSVEAELGTVGGKEDTHDVKDKDAIYTNPAQARDFVEKTGVNSLAVAIGTAHGFYQGEPKLDFKRLEEIRRVVDIPLVLHGASGVPDRDVQTAIGLGICKVNFATELRVAFTQGVGGTIANVPGVYDPKKYNGAGREAVMQLVKEKIQICGSAFKY